MVYGKKEKEKLNREMRERERERLTRQGFPHLLLPKQSRLLNWGYPFLKYEFTLLSF